MEVAAVQWHSGVRVFQHRHITMRVVVADTRPMIRGRKPGTGRHLPRKASWILFSHLIWRISQRQQKARILIAGGRCLFLSVFVKIARKRIM